MFFLNFLMELNNLFLTLITFYNSYTKSYNALVGLNIYQLS